MELGGLAGQSNGADGTRHLRRSCAMPQLPAPLPPATARSYDLELLDWEAPEERGDPRGMLFEERLEAAERRRADGNTAFKEGRFAEATSKYRCDGGRLVA